MPRLTPGPKYLKQMKKIIIFSVLSLCFVLFFAGVHDRTRPLASASVFGASNDQSYLLTGGNAGDTIVVSDTMQIPISVTHSAVLKPFCQFYFDKIGSGTATTTVTFWQSNDGVAYKQILKGVNQSAYSKTLTSSADTTHYINFMADTAYLDGRFFKIRLINSNTANVKFKITSRIKFNL